MLPRSVQIKCENRPAKENKDGVRRFLKADVEILSDQSKTLTAPPLSGAAHNNKLGDKAVAPFGAITLNKHAFPGGGERPIGGKAVCKKYGMQHLMK